MSVDDLPRTRKPRGEYKKSKQTRLRILDAGLAVFSENGYRSGSLREIAELVAMSEAGLLHHFPGKSALLAALLDHRDNLSRERVNLDAEDGLDTLRGLVDLARHNATTPGVVELYCTLSAEATTADHPAHQYFVDRYTAVRDGIWQAFTRIEKLGLLRPGVDPRRAAIKSIALWDGLQIQWLLDRDVLDMGDELHEYFQSLVTVPL
ncbi:TetR/AcrR family transcriptional regulator [Pengzhenrongella sp.]|jgi:AcrR family transcriptional regulator|uniref:TetR/AcrR family transcriptional regulator n=1 Tax=Pengzhenrongella sp. TaxID=2888820 RepID=UPI002F940525